MLQLGSSVGGFWSIELKEHELKKFEQLVSHANEQLKEAHVEETFLVLIEEGYNPKDPPEIAEAFTNISPESYPTIKHVYFMRGKEVAEIPLPTP